MPAGPGAISDVNIEGKYWRLTVLDEDMTGNPSHLIDPCTGDIIEKAVLKPAGITGTGLIASLALAMQTGLIKKPPRLKYGKLILGKGIHISESDIKEAGKAIGAIRAAQLTLIIEAGLAYDELVNTYMTGASGTYVDPWKAMYVGSCPKYASRVVQFGNTSLSLAKRVLIEESKLSEVIDLASRIKIDHLMMATSATFKKFYTCELSFWTEGMDMELYNRFLKIYKLPILPAAFSEPLMEKSSRKDIAEAGSESIGLVDDIGVTLEEIAPGCIMCHQCEDECPEKAISSIENDGAPVVRYSTQRCLGTACKRCVKICPVKAIEHREIRILP